MYVQIDTLAGFTCNLHSRAEQCKRHKQRSPVCPLVSSSPDTYLVLTMVTGEPAQRCA